MPPPGDEGLRRDIGFAGSAFLAFNGIVGAGIFALPGTLAAEFGAFSPWLFPLFAVLILLVAVPFAAMAARFPVSGGPVAYAAGFGPFAAFQAGWLYYLARVTALAANANVFATYIASVWASAGTPLGRAAVIALLIGALAWINLVGVARAIRALDIITLLKAAPLLALAVWGLAASAGPPPPGPPPALDGIEAAALLVLYAFVGFENSVVPAGETRRPARTIPRAMITTIVATAALYCLVQLAYVAVMPPGPTPEAPLIAFGAAVAGAGGAAAITAAALFSVAGNISGSLTSTPRATFAMGRDALLPACFARVAPRWGTPGNSILFMAAFGLVLALSGSFVWLAVMSTLARLLVYALSIAALARIDRRPAVLAMVVAGLAVCAWAASQSAGAAWVTLAVMMVAGLGLFLVAKRPR